MKARYSLPGRYGYGALTAGLFAICGPSGAAWAQAPDETDSYSGALEQIVVTARRREESIQDVPLSITAITGDQLARMGAASIVEVGQVSPNVTLEVSRATNTTLTAFTAASGSRTPCRDSKPASAFTLTTFI